MTGIKAFILCESIFSIFLCHILMPKVGRIPTRYFTASRQTVFLSVIYTREESQTLQCVIDFRRGVSNGSIANSTQNLHKRIHTASSDKINHRVSLV